jgi:hypothetical protein
VLPLGRRDRTLIQQLHRTDSSTPRLRRPGRRADTAAGTRDHAMGNTRLRVPRSFLDPRTAGSRNRAMGYQKNPRISDWQRRHRARRPALLRQPATPSPRPVHGETSACPLDKRAAISACVPVPLLPEGLYALMRVWVGRGRPRPTPTRRLALPVAAVSAGTAGGGLLERFDCCVACFLGRFKPALSLGQVVLELGAELLQAR